MKYLIALQLAVCLLAATVLAMPTALENQAPLTRGDSQTHTSPSSEPPGPTSQSGGSWYLNPSRWLQGGDVTHTDDTPKAARCFCSGGSVCCNGRNGVECNHGLCGI